MVKKAKGEEGNIMTAKEYLQQYRTAENEINAKLDHIRRLRELAEKTTQSLSKGKVHVTSENKIEDIISKIVDMENEIGPEVDRLRNVQKQVKVSINNVRSGKLRTILQLRYINGLRWEEIAVKLNYDYRWVLRLHGQALREIKIRH